MTDFFNKIRAGRLPAIMPGDGGVSVALAGGGRPEIVHCRFPVGVDLTTPVQAGEFFAAFLKDHGIRARSVACAVLPDEWVVLKHVTLPVPQDTSLLDGMVAMAIERNFAEGAGQLAITWSPGPMDGRKSIGVSMAACSRKRLNSLVEFCIAAGLKLQAAAPLSATVAAGYDRPGVILLESCGRASLSLVSDSLVVESRSLNCSGTGEIKSALARAALAFSSQCDTAGYELLYSSDREMASEVSSALGIKDIRRIGSLEWLVDNSEAALLGVFLESPGASDRPTMNMLAESRSLSGKTARPLLGRVAAFVAMVIVLAGLMGLRWHSVRSDISDMKERSSEIAEEMAQVKYSSEMASRTNSYFRGNEYHLDVMKAVTLQFPQEASIWLTRLSVKRNGEISFAGRANTRADVLELLGKFQESGEFDELAGLNIRTLSGSRRGVSFAASYIYDQSDKADKSGEPAKESSQ